VIGWLSAAFSGGLILGPGIGGVVAGISYKTPFWVAGALGLLSAIVLVILLPADRQIDPDREAITAATTTAHHPMTRAFWTVPIIILFTMILVIFLWLTGV
jgi:MFS transporter, DHA1 family, multidrug resistance protein